MRVEIVSKVLLPLLTYLSSSPTSLGNTGIARSARSLFLFLPPSYPLIWHLSAPLPLAPAPRAGRASRSSNLISFDARQPHTASLEES